MQVYTVLSTMLGSFKQGDHISEDQLNGLDVERLLSLNAISPTSVYIPELDDVKPEEGEAVDTVAYRTNLAQSADLNLLSTPLLKKIAIELKIADVPTTRDQLLAEIASKRTVLVAEIELAELDEIVSRTDLEQPPADQTQNPAEPPVEGSEQPPVDPLSLKIPPQP